MMKFPILILVAGAVRSLGCRTCIGMYVIQGEIAVNQSNLIGVGCIQLRPHFIMPTLAVGAFVIAEYNNGNRRAFMTKDRVVVFLYLVTSYCARRVRIGRGCCLFNRCLRIPPFRRDAPHQVAGAYAERKKQNQQSVPPAKVHSDSFSPLTTRYYNRIVGCLRCNFFHDEIISLRVKCHVLYKWTDSG